MFKTFTAAFPHLLISLGTVAAIGLLAMGASFILLRAAGLWLDNRFVVYDPPLMLYSPERCNDFMTDHPESPDCAAAAAAVAADDYADASILGFWAIVLGLLALGGVLTIRRIWRGPWQRGKVLPDSFSATVGTTAFGLAALVLMAAAAQRLAFMGGADAVPPLCGGIVSLAMFVVYAALFLRKLERQRADTAKA